MANRGTTQKEMSSGEVVERGSSALNAEEARYVAGLIGEHLNYYGLLAGSTKCTPANRQRYELVKGIWEKLQKQQTSKLC